VSWGSIHRKSKCIFRLGILPQSKSHLISPKSEPKNNFWEVYLTPAADSV
jgi:hypothetical protein